MFGRFRRTSATNASQPAVATPSASSSSPSPSGSSPAKTDPASEPLSPPRRGFGFLSGRGRLGSATRCETGAPAVGVAEATNLSAKEDSKPVIIFDWDDTLCPTWWIWHVMAFGIQDVVPDETSPDPKMMTILKARKELSRENSRFRTQLEDNARIVEACLRGSRALGRVSIVTMGTQLWFEHSSATFFPGVDMPGLLRELGILTYYATLPDRIPDNMDPKVAAKRMVMTECLVKHYGIGVVQWNVLSVGDQPEERDALKLCCRDCPHRWRRKPICKTFTVPPEPMLQDQIECLRRLCPAITRLVQHDKDADWRLDTPGW